MPKESKKTEQVKDRFLRKLRSLNYKLNSFYQKGIKPDSDDAEKFIRFLKKIVSMKMPREIENDDDAFEALLLLQSEARQTLREISWNPC